MATNKEHIASLEIKKLLSEDRYVIPIYQRNYDWGEDEAVQLIEDIADYAKHHKKQNYYIGSAIVFERSEGDNCYFELIDGQQRLTTLTILASLLKNNGFANWYNKINLSYDHRKEADEALSLLFDENFKNCSIYHNIIDVYKILDKNLRQTLDSRKLCESDFSNYLFSKVIILRIHVPQDTQLNHYFEIMNTRGVQLEKHEVLKAVLMNNLNQKEHRLFNLIWEACSDMSSYVQMNFPATYRTIIFDDNCTNLKSRNFDDLQKRLLECEAQTKDIIVDEFAPKSLKYLFEDAKNNIKYDLPHDGSANERKQNGFGAIINFPNFLLQVLKVCSYKCDLVGKEKFSDIRLDDKNLITTFDNILKSVGDKKKKRFVKYFIMELLFIRMQFDKYVIKREYTDGNVKWSLKRLQKRPKENAYYYVNTFSLGDTEDENDTDKDVRMLEAMFHVSSPTQIYKHWLNAVLYRIYKDTNIDASTLAHELYNLACCYMLDVYIGTTQTDFESIIYQHEDQFIPSCHTIDWEKIDCGCSVPNYIFNFYDYITWKNDPSKYSKFEFTYKTSVEHFYPQHPKEGFEKLEDRWLNSFGNLCLISREMNSTFGNNMPCAKRDNFGRTEEVRNGLSLKLLEMMDVVKNEGEWKVSQIDEFERNSRQKILEALQQNQLQTIIIENKLPNNVI